jgi:hypothetical protein
MMGKSFDFIQPGAQLGTAVFLGIEGGFDAAKTGRQLGQEVSAARQEWQAVTPGGQVLGVADDLAPGQKVPLTAEARAKDPSRIAGGDLRHVNGALGEEHGWRSALADGHRPIQGPDKVSARGPDFITYNPETRSVVVWDAKYRGPGGRYPKTLPAKQLKSWMKEVRSAVDALEDADLRHLATEALENGRLTGEIFKWPR